ncbi:MAG: hypothetical protein ACI8X3_002502, partial [Saprospiraceae bacterium]
SPDCTPYLSEVESMDKFSRLIYFDLYGGHIILD